MGNIPCPPSISQHVDILWLLFLSMLGISIYLFWRMLTRIERKSEENNEILSHLRESLPKEYVCWTEFNKFREELRDDRLYRWSELRDDFKEILGKFWTHSHEPNGTVRRVP